MTFWEWLKAFFAPEPHTEEGEIAPGIPKPSYVVSRLIAKEMIANYQLVKWQTHESFYHGYKTFAAQKKRNQRDHHWLTTWLTFDTDKVSIQIVGMIFKRLSEQDPFSVKEDNLKRRVIKVGGKEIELDQDEFDFIIKTAKDVVEMKKQFELHEQEHIRQQAAVDAIEHFMGVGIPYTDQFVSAQKQLEQQRTVASSVDDLLQKPLTGEIGAEPDLLQVLKE